MKATLTKDYFSDPDWIYEPKLDGIRGLAFKRGKEVTLLSRKKLPLSDSYAIVVEALRKQKSDFILDGELAAIGWAGKTSFGLLQQARLQKVPLAYFVFDCVFLDGTDLRKKAVLERKEALLGALRWKEPLQYVEHVAEEGEALYAAACKNGLEGVIAKQAASPYVGARSKDWLKFKCSNEQEFVIGGFTDPQGSRVGLGALLVGYYENGKLLYAGKVGTGFNAKFLVDLRKRLEEIEIDEPPFAADLKPRAAHWVKPKLVAQVAFAEWTGDGRLRHPAFVGLRETRARKASSERSLGRYSKAGRRRVPCLILPIPKFEGGTMDRGKQRLSQLLVEAHANELALINTLEAHIRLAETGPYRSLLKEHLRETKSHATRVKRRLDRIGYSESLLSRAYGLAQNTIKQGLVFAKAPVDLIRSGGDVHEKMLRNARDEVMTEGMEIAAYDAIESIARGLGDTETAELAAMIRIDEEQMLDALRKEIPVLAELFVQKTLAESPREVGEPWPGYDDQTVDEIKNRLTDARAATVITVVTYEKANKNRTTVIEAAERETASV